MRVTHYPRSSRILASPKDLLHTLEVDNILNHPFFFEKRMVAYIQDQKDHLINSPEHLKSLNPDIIKIEGLENYSNTVSYDINQIIKHIVPTNLKVTAHLFVSKKDAISFPLHTDPAHVIITMLEGQKDYIVEDNGETTVYTIKTGELLLLPANTPHMALNTHGSKMLSIGIEPFYKHQMKNS